MSRRDGETLSQQEITMGKNVRLGVAQGSLLFVLVQFGGQARSKADVIRMSHLDTWGRGRAYETFGSIIRRGWVTVSPGEGNAQAVTITASGYSAIYPRG